MTSTSTIKNRGIEGNRRVNYGTIGCTSSDVTMRSLSTGLRMVDTLHAWHSISGGLAIVTYPLTFPALDATSGNFTLEFTTPESGVVYWKAKGKS